MEKELLIFILEWRFELKLRGYRKGSWRKLISEQFLKCPGYLAGKWTSKDFCEVWEKNIEQIMFNKFAKK